MNILDTRENLNAMVLKHEQQIKDIAAHLLELKRLVTPMMEFKREKLLQEPVAKVDDLERGGRVRALALCLSLDAPLYAAPPQRTWVGLTWDDTPQYMSEEFIQGARWAEATLKEKNYG